jgi:hypothetical protein
MAPGSCGRQQRGGGSGTLRQLERRDKIKEFVEKLSPSEKSKRGTALVTPLQEQHCHRQRQQQQHVEQEQQQQQESATARLLVQTVPRSVDQALYILLLIACFHVFLIHLIFLTSIFSSSFHFLPISFVFPTFFVPSFHIISSKITSADIPSPRP